MVNVPRRSSTFSEMMRGTWKSVVMSSLRMRVQKCRVPDYLEYSSTMSCSWTGAEISERSG